MITMHLVDLLLHGASCVVFVVAVGAAIVVHSEIFGAS